MRDSQVTLKIEGIEVTVPKGTLIVDAAKQAGIDIPVFCYHPKLDPVGMCRMCLVELGTPRVDRTSGEIVRSADGEMVIEYREKLETACTAPVSEGMDVRVTSDKAVTGRKQIVEFLLTSHPLDCPICDKGGECPLQDQTMEHGPGKSRFLYEDKKHLAKNVPLGDLIFLDRERCIQCGRCVRFQEQLVDEPVIGFGERGRSLEIVTFTDPGFDSYFSGNTTDICPVGALTTADFRFGARPWELHATASICTHCPVGCNLVLNTRREAQAGGHEVIKRILPRQNEAVNEIWICDKGRFAHHFATSEERLSRPLMRVDGELIEVDWEQALKHAAQGMAHAGEGVLGIAGGRASNEDLFNFKQVIEGLGGQAVLDSAQGGGDWVEKLGVGQGTNLKTLGDGDAILLIASDLHEEAPIWWQRVIAAVKRGASLVIANGRETSLDHYAAHVLRYQYPQAVHTALGLLHAVQEDKNLEPYTGDPALAAASASLAGAQNLVIFFGSEGLDLSGSEALAQACARFLVLTGHAGKPNNGLIAVWREGNAQGAWDLGLRPTANLAEAIKRSGAMYVMAADPLGSNPGLAQELSPETFLVVQELFLTATAAAADVVLPARSFVEREGTFTSGERRVQRFFQALKGRGQARADWLIAANLAGELGIEVETRSAAQVFENLARTAPGYEGLDYGKLAVLDEQWPPVGDDDLYFGGTAQKNRSGVGVQLPNAVQRGEAVDPGWMAPPDELGRKGLLLVPISRLYDPEATILHSKVLAPRLAPVVLRLNPADAKRLKLEAGAQVEIRVNGFSAHVTPSVEEEVPRGVALMNRSQEIPARIPHEVDVKPVG
jgi:NADH-quinone oxidoreductase subunit G